MPHRCDDQATGTGRHRTRPNEPFYSAIPLTAIHAPDGRPLARLEEHAGHDGADDGGDALEDGRAGDRDARVFGLASGTFEGSVVPRR